jgi:CRISPR-associated helicase Cas3/CRISPR-associated endonuclease Cas3-HD
MRSLDQVWAKSRAHASDPRGELLTEHLTKVAAAARLLRDRTGVVPGLPEYFWECVILAGLFHDAGKIPEGFQRMVHDPGPKTVWGHRHEVYSLGFVRRVLAHLPPEQLALIAAGVATHHRALTGGDRKRSLRGMLSNVYQTPRDTAEAMAPVDPVAARELHEWLLQQTGITGIPAPPPEDLAAAACAQLRDVIDQWTDQPDADPVRDLTAVLLQGAVTLADHVASADVDLLACQPFDAAWSKDLTARLAPLFPHQRQAQAITGHLLLRAPTGYGKTEAALLWAATQVEDLRRGTGGMPRVFYTLPYLASINATTGRLHRELGSAGEDLVGVAHSRAASYYLHAAADDDCAAPDVDAARRALARNRATRLFREPVRVGTPYQLVRGALAGPAHSGILIDAANSVFILDELHAYEPGKLGIILAMIGLWTRLGGRIGVLSATFPAALAELIAIALGEEPALVMPDKQWTWPVRHQLELRSGHLTEEASTDEIAGRLRAGHSVLVIANSVKDAISLYDQFAPETVARYGQDAALLLHSRFTTRDRNAIEEKIHRRYEAGKPRQPGLLVATQTVEVSLNIDFDVTHTSAAPLESLIQRFGRVNRLGRLAAPAPVIVHEPAWVSRGRSAQLYADGVYDAEPVQLAWQLLTRYDGSQLDEQLFTGWLDEIYASDWGQRWREAVDAVYQRWNGGWLQFRDPFSSRDDLSEAFDELFDGNEALLERDVGKYRDRLLAGTTKATGRLLAAELLLPIPHYAQRVGRWDKSLGVTVIDADYNSTYGLRKIRGRNGDQYATGVVL